MLVAVGGGTVSDLVGFVAATYARGIRWCAIPTTLAGGGRRAVGGKTGINLEAGKNLVGAFYHPRSWRSIRPVFASLDGAIWRRLAEAVKTGCVADPAVRVPRGGSCRGAGRDRPCWRRSSRTASRRRRRSSASMSSTAPTRAVLNFGPRSVTRSRTPAGTASCVTARQLRWACGCAAASRERELPRPVADRIDAAAPGAGSRPESISMEVIEATATDKKRKDGRCASSCCATSVHSCMGRRRRRTKVAVRCRAVRAGMTILVVHGPNLNLWANANGYLRHCHARAQLNAEIVAHAGDRCEVRSSNPITRAHCSTRCTMRGHWAAGS